MKLSELKTAIRSIVKEEVAIALNEFVNSGTSTTYMSPPPKQNKTQIAPNRVQIKTGNPLIDNVIAETTLDRGPSSVGPSVSVDGGFAPEESYPVPSTLNETVGVELPPFMQRDYRKILKAADQKAKVHRGGNGPL
jgi:hypothetical protein